MNMRTTSTFHAECRKLYRAPIARIAALAIFAIVSLTSLGGYAAAVSAPTTDLGRKAASMLTATGWAGFTGLAAMSLGVSVLLGCGIVMAWSVGREFADGTIVGLFAIPTSRSVIALAKVGACGTWGASIVLATSSAVTLGGAALGLPASGGASCCLRLTTVGLSVMLSAMPVMWVATHWRGYLARIGATLAIVIATNIAAGFGLGAHIPWSVPMLWATPGSQVSLTALCSPAGVGLLGAVVTCVAWEGIQLGKD